MKKRFIVRLEEFKEPLKSKIVISKDGIELEQGDLSDEEFEQEKKIFADFIMSQAKKYPVATTKRIQAVSTAIDNPTRTAFNPVKNENAYKKRIELLVGHTTSKNHKPITASFRIEIDRLEGVTLPDEALRLDYFTRAVYNTICSTWQAGNSFFTLQMLVEATTGRQYRPHSEDKELLQEFKKAIERLSRNRVILNRENEAKYTKCEIKNITDNLLHTRGVTAKINGQFIECYEIIIAPALFEYAKSQKHVESCDIQKLALPTGVKATPDNIALREYLYTEIIDMKNPNSKRSHNILFSTLFKALRLEELSRRDKGRVRERVKLILDAFKKNGIIADYEIPEAEAGKSIEKIIITPMEITLENVSDSQTLE